MTDYSDLVSWFRISAAGSLDPHVGQAADAIEKLERITQNQSDALNVLRGSIANYQVGVHEARIAELEHQMKFECDTYLWNRKRMSRRIALLEYWMEKVFKYGSLPEARRNELTMATEIPDSLMREGEDILRHLEERSDLEKVDGII